MKDRTVSLFTVRGIPIGLDPSWFLIFALITWSLAMSYFPGEFEHWTSLQSWSIAIITSILFFSSVVLHELGHSFVALMNRIPVKSINLYIFGGIAQITSEPATARAELIIALAGPLTSLLLAGFFYVIMIVFRSVEPVYAMTKYLALINATLAVFNLIPGFPLDGGRVFRAIVWRITNNLRRATEIAGVLGRIIAFLFILYGVWQIFQGNWSNGLWIAFIGWFLENAASSQVQQQRMRDLLAGRTVSQVMTNSCVMASEALTLQELVDEYFLNRGTRCVILMRAERSVGMMTIHNIRQVPRDQWASTRAGQVMTPLTDVKITSPDMPLEDALEQMGTDGVNQLPVMKDGQVEGMLTREDIVNYLNVLHSLEKQ